MYNRYIPQSDGSYHRSRMPESNHPAAAPKPSGKPTCPPPEPPPCEVPRKEPPPRPPRRDESIGGFLKQLLPKGFDTGDLIVMLLLLLMAGDCEEDRSNALLTLALYFIL